VYFVARHDQVNRAGNVWLSPGYRYTRAGRFIATAKVKFPAIDPVDLGQRLRDRIGSDLRAVTTFTTHGWHR
jgi:hypothetical protein